MYDSLARRARHKRITLSRSENCFNYVERSGFTHTGGVVVLNSRAAALNRVFENSPHWSRHSALGYKLKAYVLLRANGPIYHVKLTPRTQNRIDL